MTQIIRDNLVWFLAGLCLLPLVPVMPFRWGWIACLACFFWADSSMPAQEVARAGRFGLLPLVVGQAALRLRSIRGGEKPPGPLLVLLAWAAASLFWTPAPLFAAIDLGVALCVGMLVFGYLPRLSPDAGAALALVRTSVVVLLGLLALGLVPPLHRSEFFVSGRFRGFFSNANGLGLTCALLAPWPLVFARGRDPATRLRAFAVVGVLGGLAFLSGSRTGCGGLLVSVSVTLFLLHPSRFLLGLGLAGLAFTVWAVAGVDVDLEGGATAHLVREGTIGRLSGRVDHWKAGLEEFGKHPLAGAGYTASRNLHYTFAVERPDGTLRWVQSEGENFHSQHVEALVDFGVAGEGLLLWLLGSLVARFRRLARSARDPRAAAAGAALTGTTLAVAIDSFFHNWLLTFGSPYSLLFWALVGLGLRLERIERDAAAPAPAPPPPSPRLEPAGAPA